MRATAANFRFLASRTFLRALLFTTIALWLCGSIAWAQHPEVCSANGYASLAACPQTCAQACRDPLFSTASTAASRACRAVITAGPSATDAAECRPSYPPGTTLPQIGEQWLAEVQEQCTAGLERGTAIQIPDSGQQIAACAVSLPNLTCRFRRIADAAAAYADEAEAFPEFGNLVGTQMCELSASELEEAYRTAEAMQAPLERLGRFFEEENGCEREVIESIREMECLPGDNACDLRREQTLAITDQRLEESRAQSGRYRTAIEKARAAQQGIVAMYTQYRFLCGS